MAVMVGCRTELIVLDRTLGFPDFFVIKFTYSFSLIVIQTISKHNAELSSIFILLDSTRDFIYPRLSF